MAIPLKANDVCCPEFDPALWDDKTVEWTNKTFIKERVATFFYMPVNFGGKMTKLTKTVDEAGATVPDWLCLSDHSSKWNMDLYLAVNKNIQGANNTTMSGKFYFKVYEGSFNETGKWCKDAESTVKSKGQNVKKMYMWYTT
ncbi:MAG: hydrolase, partial [Bacteroidota bacterium]